MANRVSTLKWIWQMSGSVTILFASLSCKFIENSSNPPESHLASQQNAIGIAVSVDMGPGKTAVMAYQYLDQTIPKVLGEDWQVDPFGSFRRGFLVSKRGASQSQLEEALLKIRQGIIPENLKASELAYHQQLASFDTFSSTTDEFPEYAGLSTKDPEWHLIFMDVFKAWDKLKSEKGKLPGEGVLIGQIDTGLLPHPEIQVDGNFIRQILWDSSKNFVEKNVSHAVDAYVTEGDKPVPSHGTATASVIISPRGQQLIGEDAQAYVTGIAPGAKLLPMRATTSAVLMGVGQLLDVANAVGEVRRQGAKVISLSLAGRPDPFLWAAIRNAVADGIIVVAAGGANSKIQPWPGQFSETILATAGTIQCTPWEDATFSPSVDITVPGVDVWHATTYKRRNGEMLWASRRGIGTSFSAPLLAGAAAIWISYHGWDNLANRYGKENIYKVFRKVLESPEGHRTCKALDPKKHGVGYLNVMNLLTAPLPRKL
ncbi:MAG: S8/S53 family peptidase [Pseudomonadota bacterium]